MTFSTLTQTQRISNQSSSRNGRSIDMVILHHSATTNAEQVLRMMETGSRTVSANYVLGNDGHIYGVVPEEKRAWTSGSPSDGGKGADFDRRAITFECANLSVNGWTISEATYASLGKLIADFHRRYGVPLDRDHIVGHRELYTRWGASYATACPGGMDLDKVVRLAKSYALGKPSPVAQGKPASTPPVSKTKLAVDGLLGTETIKHWQKDKGTPVDGKISSPSALVRAIQTQMNAAGFRDWDGRSLVVDGLGLVQDGKTKTRTNYVLQKFLGTPADGILGRPSPCIKALQKRLNTGRF